jgi:ATP-dependent RNA helicase DHR2
MLLQEFLRDPQMKQYSTIIIDEVHERSVNVDLILGFLKQLLIDRRGALKVVIMSATADVEGIAKFFSDTQQPVSNGHSTDEALAKGDAEEKGSEASWTGFSDDTADHQLSVATCHVEGRQYPVKLHYLDHPTEDVADSALQRIFTIHTKEALPGDILVFMTGQESIQGLQKLIEEYAESLPREIPKLLVLPLFAALSLSAQQRIFEPTPKFTRKVILSTNIAETSVTVPGVRFIVDTGKAKLRQFRSQIGLESLLVRPISKSSADQRKGRAGREAPGQCYRLYTEEGYQSLDKDNKPEILRCDLSEAVLNMKARGADDVLNFPFLDPPSQAAMERALMQLLRLGTLEEDGKISKVGLQVASLPLTPSLGRVIVEAAKLECLLEVIDIVACLSVENIFLNVSTEETREQAQSARAQLFRRQGDHLTMLAAVQAYAAEDSDRRRWADDHLISHRAMKAVMAVRKQLRAQCKSAKMLPEGSMDTEAATPSEETSERIVKAFLRGFIDNVARLCPDSSYKTFSGNHTVAIHPSSVLFGRKVELIMYNEFVYTSKAYARGVSVVQTKWLEELYDTL